MRINILIKRLLFLCLMAFSALSVLTAAAEEADPPAKWTVMLYMCGSDLESKNGIASLNLHQIMNTQRVTQTLLYDENGDLMLADVPMEVNVLVETGGASEWKNARDEKDVDWGLNISSESLQRYVLSNEQSEDGYYPLELVMELPQASMADPETLTDYIRWGTEQYPSEKYMLVLWGHGGGSSTGLLYDECNGADILYLYELENALKEADVQFEVVLMDACLMCNLETAMILKPFAKYMVASEELVPGYGSAFQEWLRVLFLNPDSGGDQIGEIICDKTQEKYSISDDDLSQKELTLAVVDLSKIDRVARAFDDLFSYLGKIYETRSELLQVVLVRLFSVSYLLGTGNEYMRDLGAFLYAEYLGYVVNLDIRNELENALLQAIEYNTTGPYRAGNFGLSFCYPVNMDPEDLDLYARNCKSAPYLAFLDAAKRDWAAPDWVYEQVDRLTPCEEIPEFTNLPEMVIENGVPVMKGSVKDTRIWQCFYELYREDEKTGQIYRLGMDEASHESWTEEGTQKYVFHMDNPAYWPSIDGQLCSLKYKQQWSKGVYDLEGTEMILFDVPIQNGADVNNLRIGYWEDTDKQTGEETRHYEVYGITESFSETASAPSRSATALSTMLGQDYQLLYPLYAEGENVENAYAKSEELTMYRNIDMEEMLLPAGTYYCRYILQNCLEENFTTDMVKLYWDGTDFSAAE